MPRTKISKIEKMLLTDSWRTFGRWLRSRRIAKRFTQKQAARAADVSRRQWIRYEQGEKVLPKHLAAISDALDVPIRRILNLAGEKTSPRRNDSNHRLRQIDHMLRVGNLDDALEALFLLYHHTWRTKGKFSDSDGLTAPNFARAVILLDGLPAWLCDVILTCMQKRLSQTRKPTGMDTDLRVLVLQECIEEIQRMVPSLP